MPYTDSHGRPEFLMHPDTKRGVAGYRLETPPAQQAPEKSRSAKARKPGKPRPADAE